jgi:hypothetical protein
MVKMKKVALFFGALYVVTLPALVFAAPRTFSDLVFQIVAVIDRVVPVIIAATVLVYFWRTMRNIVVFGSSPGKEGKGGGAEQRGALLQGLLVIFIMVSIWGILRLFVSTFLVG